MSVNESVMPETCEAVMSVLTGYQQVNILRLPGKAVGAAALLPGDAAPLPELIEKLSVLAPRKEAVVGTAGGAHMCEEVCESW